MSWTLNESLELEQFAELKSYLVSQLQFIDNTEIIMNKKYRG